MRALGKGIAWTVFVIVITLLAATFITARQADPTLWPPTAGSPGVEIHVVSHGYHSGIVVTRASAGELASRQGNVAVLAITQRFAAYNWLEIGWGDEGFYTFVPDVASLTFAQAARALLLPGNKSVVHVV